jgi:hypothetical protein
MTQASYLLQSGLDSGNREKLDTSIDLLRPILSAAGPDGQGQGALTRNFYRNLADVSAAAAVLHAVTRQLRDECPEDPSVWAAHIHAGA